MKTRKRSQGRRRQVKASVKPFLLKMSQQQNDEERKCIGRGWNTMRGHPPLFPQAQHSIQTACPVALEIPRNSSKTAFVSSKVEVAGLCCNKTRDKRSTLKYQKVLIKMLGIPTVRAAWAFSAKFTCGSLALATVHHTDKTQNVTKQTDPSCSQWQLSTLFLQLSFYLPEILVGTAEELMF